MFMIPTPPLRRDTEAIAASSIDSTREEASCALRHLGEVPHLEVVFPIVLDLVALTKQGTDLLQGERDEIAVGDLDRDRLDRSRARRIAADDVAAGRGQRDQGDVVLILAPGALTLAVEYAHDPERDVLDPDALADRIGVTEQLSGHRPAEHDDLGGGIALVLRDRAARDDVPLLNREELRRHRVEHRDPVLVASDQPDPARREWGRGVDEGKLTLEGPGILFGYRRKRSRADARSAHGRGPGPDEHQIGAHAADLLDDALASPRPHRQHGDHRRHADDHPERRQGGTQLVGAQRAEGDAGIGQRAHLP